MALEATSEILGRIKAHAYGRLTPQQIRTTNLSLDKRVYKKGDALGLPTQRVILEGPAVLVFADDKPLANFGHDCRYFLYDPETGKLQRDIPARFPPNLIKSAELLDPFYEPVRFVPGPPGIPNQPPYRCPHLIPNVNRYAILFAGCTQLRHLNDMEFCYRMLIDGYGFSAQNIHVLNYDGDLRVWDKILTANSTWPGDNTPYRIQVTGRGTRAAFQAVVAELKTKIKAEDWLFIHTNNHGDDFLVPGYARTGSFMCAFLENNIDPILFDYWTPYYATDFAADLGVLPKFSMLMAMMEQCKSGGFNAPIIKASPAASTSIASAATASVDSEGTADGNWDIFALNWIAAMMGHNPDGSVLASNPDTNGDGVVDAQEAYCYACSQDSPDTPEFTESLPGAIDSLSLQYALSSAWCMMVGPILQRYYARSFPEAPPIPNPPDPAYYTALNSVTPELQALILPALQRSLVALRRELTPQIEASLNAAFKTNVE